MISPLFPDSFWSFKHAMWFISKKAAEPPLGLITVSAMVGLLNAPKHTRLYKRLETENRLLKESSGNNTDLTLNFIPRMNYHELMNGYNKIIHDIYTTKPYYRRIRRLL